MCLVCEPMHACKLPELSEGANEECCHTAELLDHRLSCVVTIAHQNSIPN